MMKINQIWNELENDTSFSNGLLMRRYSSSILPDVYISIQYPEKIFCICILISNSTNINISLFANLQEIQFDLLPPPNQKGKSILLFKIINNQHKDIFSVLCEDLITNIANENNEKTLINKILDRFEKWKTLFNKIGLTGLTMEEQRGLFGELYFLRKFLYIESKYMEVINTWIGTEKQVRDFQFGTWAVEVKTTYGNNHQKIHISSERQLDITNLETLYLYHISLEQMQNSGETLNEIVDSIKEILNKDTSVLNKFNYKLYETGYFDFQRNIYDKYGYFIRQDVFYKVETHFPRIQENEIRSGVGDVKYSIIVSQCGEFIQTENIVFLNLKLL